MFVDLRSYRLIIIVEIDGGLLFRRTHLILRSCQRREKLAMYGRRFEVSESFGNISLNPPIRILINCRWYQAPPFLQEAWQNLYARIEYHANVCFASEPENCLREVVIYPFCDLENQWVSVSNELRVLQYECPVWVETSCDDIEYVFVRPVLCVHVCEVSFHLEELFIVRDLNVDISLELVLE